MLNKYSALLIVVGSLFSAFSLAATNNTPVLNYLQLAKWETTINAQLKEQVRIATAANPEQAEQIADYYKQIMGWQALKPSMIKVIRSTFTDAELMQINAFYQTTAGEKLAAQSAEISKKMMQIIQANSKAYMHQKQHVKAHVKDCVSETTDIGPDIAVIENAGTTFTLLLSRDKTAPDYLKVYYDDSYILEGSKAKNVLEIITSAKNELKGRRLACFELFIASLKETGQQKDRQKALRASY